MMSTDGVQAHIGHQSSVSLSQLVATRCFRVGQLLPLEEGRATLFGQRAGDWAETWEGPKGWGTPVYEYVLDRVQVSDGSEVLDCGCGAGRFARMAADRGARVSGVDASAELVDIAAERTPEGDFRVGDLETLPWGDESFDLVTGFSVSQFADDKIQAVSEAGRVSRGSVAVVVPTRTSESGPPKRLNRSFPCSHRRGWPS